MKKNKLYATNRRKGNKIFPIMVVTTIFACIVTVIIAGSYMYTSSSLSKYEKAISELTLEIDVLEKNTNEIKAQEEEYKNKINSVAEELSKYEPIVIPESMK